jgi:hypothetical protein
VSDVISSSYGNPGMGSCGVGVVSEGGVIDAGDIGFNDDDLRVVVGDVDAALLVVVVLGVIPLTVSRQFVTTL